jgi:hypothetical protein
LKVTHQKNQPYPSLSCHDCRQFGSWGRTAN